ncbi:sensor histidine kinase [Paenibacillus terricola]|nr:HAMP domain-containing sensor histidine kinase [Paenibacillus terricola]
MKKNDSNGSRSTWVTAANIGGIAALFASVLLLGSGWFVQRQALKDRNEEQAIYWNRYAANYYETQGGWQGLEERLSADVRDYPLHALNVLVFDVNGKRVAQGGAAVERSSDNRKPIVEDGAIIGYTQTAISRGASIPGAAWIGSIIAFITCYALWLLLIKRWRSESSRMMNRVQERIAGIVPSRSSGDIYPPISPVADPYEQFAATDNRLEHDLAHIDAYVRKLETVRRSMVADIAHELRTPLAIMRSQLENALIAETPLPLEKTAFMHDELLYLTKLVHDLQELALAEAGKLPLEKSWFSLREASEAVIEALQGEAEEETLSIQLDGPTDVMVYADRVRVRQLIVNLIGNAIQHARTEVVISVHQQEGSVTWSVKDDGFGIEKEQLAHLFERFYRSASHTNDNKRRGLGLGLSIVKQYAEAHGGTIEVNSVWGEGTTFRLQLPVITV